MSRRLSAIRLTHRLRNQPDPTEHARVVAQAPRSCWLRLAEAVDGVVDDGSGDDRESDRPPVDQSGRGRRPAPRVVCTLPVCVTADPDGARERADGVSSIYRQLPSIYGQLPSYRAMLDMEGAAGPGDVAIVGDEATVAGQITALAGIGVTDLAAAVFGQPDETARTRSLLGELAWSPVGWTG